jgi:hypothetical protein
MAALLALQQRRQADDEDIALVLIMMMGMWCSAAAAALLLSLGGLAHSQSTLRVLPPAGSAGLLLAEGTVRVEP